LRVKRARSKAEVGELYMSSAIDEEVLHEHSDPHLCGRDQTYLWFKVSVDVPQLVQLVYTRKHLGCVESRMLLLEHARVVEQSAEVASRYVFLR